MDSLISDYCIDKIGLTTITRLSNILKVKATATSASIVKCGGAKLKKNTRYYVRIVTRRKRNGVFCTVPMPANNTYIDSFIIK